MWIADWEKRTSDGYKDVPLFQDGVAQKLTLAQKQAFVRIFYHLRGHFHDFLWYLGNTAPNGDVKKTIIDNIMEEFGGGRRSHEMLYVDFAKRFDVDLNDELLNQTSYVPFAKAFNKKHMEFLVNHSWDHRVAAFAAYERLDNVDYQTLMQFAVNMGTEGESLQFFKVHTLVRHYDAARDRMGLPAIWEKNEQAVKDAFEFIGAHQNWMWRQLSEYVCLKIH